MRKLFSVFLAFIIIINTYPYISVAASSEDKRGCWISFLDFEEYLRDKNEEDFRQSVKGMYAEVVSRNLNTVIVHVRAMGDAIYPSDYFPTAEWISSDRSEPGYDALDIMVQEATAAGLDFEAWINPYRLSRDQKSTDSFKNTEFYDKFKDFTIEYTNYAGETCLSLDPSREETIELISNGVKEILDNYDIKTIHFDDYFYVDGMMDSLDVSQKMDNVNNMVQTVYTTVHSYGDDYSFGISPAGNPVSARKQGADIDRWLSVEGYVDYIMPQIYWSDSYSTEEGVEHMYTDRCNEWMSLNKLDLPIYVGLALYKVGEKSSYDLGWSTSNSNLAEQYSYARDTGYDGFSLFRYEWLDKNISSSELDNLRAYLEVWDEEYEKTGNDTEDEADENVNASSEVIPADNDNGLFFFYNRNVFISYTSSNADCGWLPVVWDMQASGDEKSSVNGIRMRLGDKAGDGSVLYRICDGNGNRSKWVYDGEAVKADDYITGIQVKMSGEAAEYYDISYRVYSESGWSKWSFNGAVAGTGNGTWLLAYQVLLMPKGEFTRYNSFNAK